MDDTLFIYAVNAGDIVKVTLILVITFSMWGGFFIHLFLKRGKRK
jgi:hypothetical protein